MSVVSKVKFDLRAYGIRGEGTEEQPPVRHRGANRCCYRLDRGYYTSTSTPLAVETRPDDFLIIGVHYSAMEFVVLFPVAQEAKTGKYALPLT